LKRTEKEREVHPFVQGLQRGDLVFPLAMGEKIRKPKVARAFVWCGGKRGYGDATF